MFFVFPPPGLTPASEELSKLQDQAPAAELENDSDEFYEDVDEKEGGGEEGGKDDDLDLD